ncbi:MAG: hypothetical protein OHK0013_06250 [Sandaracinaceae bacterium]
MSSEPIGKEFEQAIERVEAVIRGLGLDPAEATIPGDASTRAYALKRGSARVVIAVHRAPGGGTFRVLAPCVRVPAAPPAELFRHLLELNARELVGVAFGVFGDDVVVVAERSVRDLDTSEVEAAIRNVGRIADRYDDALASRFGLQRSSD